MKLNIATGLLMLVVLLGGCKEGASDRESKDKDIQTREHDTRSNKDDRPEGKVEIEVVVPVPPPPGGKVEVKVPPPPPVPPPPKPPVPPPPPKPR